MIATVNNDWITNIDNSELFDKYILLIKGDNIYTHVNDLRMVHDIFRSELLIFSNLNHLFDWSIRKLYQNQDEMIKYANILGGIQSNAIKFIDTERIINEVVNKKIILCIKLKKSIPTFYNITECMTWVINNQKEIVYYSDLSPECDSINALSEMVSFDSEYIQISYFEKMKDNHWDLISITNDEMEEENDI